LRFGISRFLIAALLTCCLGAAWAVDATPEELPLFSIGFSLNSFVDIDAKDAHAAIKLWTAEMGAQAKMQATSTLYTDIMELVTDFQKGRLDVGIFTSLDYIKFEPSLKGMPAFLSVRNGKATERYVVLTSADRPGSGIASMKGSRLAYLQNDTMALLFLNTLLLRQHKPEMNQFFSSLQVKTKASQAIHAVYFGSADICVTTERAYQTMTELNPQVGRKLKAIALSPDLLQGVSAYRSGLSRDVREKAETFGKNIKLYPRGKQILTLFQIDDVVMVKESDFTATRQLYNEYRQLKGKLL
jgi:ABC-type phosphate/phosphonate transport system substrate-binding protein